MSLQANAAGVVSVTLNLPAGVTTGAKTVAVVGAGGSYGEATFVSRGVITRQEVQSVTVQRVSNGLGVDPLAQTFTLQEDRMIAGAKIYVKTKGSATPKKNPLIVQIRTVSLGVPTQEVLAEAIVAWDDIVMSPAATQALFSPVLLVAGTTYALVVLTDDAAHSLAVAEVGKWDVQAGSYVTQQPYQIGVLLSSSNAESWTVHQSMDMKFSLQAANFTATTREITLGTQEVTDATDLIVLAGVERTSVEGDVLFKLEMGGTTIEVPEQQRVQVASYTGDIVLKAVIRSGNPKFSPLLYRGVQLLAGVVSLSDDYVSRAIPAASASNLTVDVEKSLSGTASVQVYYQKDGAGAWTLIPQIGTSPASSGFLDYKHKIAVTGVVDHVRVKLVSTGTSLDRPLVRNLRAIAT